MRKAISILFIFLSIAVGATFLYSAYTKLYPIQRFEYTMVEFAHMPWQLAALAARFLIGLEAGLGALILLHFFGRAKWVLKAAAGLLILFSIYLIYLWVARGNDINCGCFGDAIWMSPSASLLKNIILLVVIFVLIKYHQGWRFRGSAWVSYLLMLAAIILPFILFAIPNNQPDWLKNGAYRLDMTDLYAPGKQDAPAVDLTKGKHIIAFFSAVCPHCQMAAYKLHLMKQKDPSLPVFMVIGGDRKLDDWWKKTESQNIPYTRLARDQFIHIVGYSWPAIFLVNNDTVEAKSSYITLDQQVLEAWLKK